MAREALRTEVAALAVTGWSLPTIEPNARMSMRPEPSDPGAAVARPLVPTCWFDPADGLGWLLLLLVASAWSESSEKRTEFSLR